MLGLCREHRMHETSRTTASPKIVSPDMASHPRELVDRFMEDASSKDMKGESKSGLSPVKKWAKAELRGRLFHSPSCLENAKREELPPPSRVCALTNKDAFRTGLIEKSLARIAGKRLADDGCSFSNSPFLPQTRVCFPSRKNLPWPNQRRDDPPAMMQLCPTYFPSR